MRKIFYLLSLIFLTTFLSCEEDDGTQDKQGVDDGIITLEQLGSDTWYMNYYIYKGEEYRVDNLTPLPEGMKDVFVDWEFDIENMVAYELPRTGDVLYITHDPFTKEGDVIKAGGYQYTIVGFETSPYDILKMRLDKTPNSYDYLGGVMVFKY